MDILLFDMDGVLLEAQGYHRALQETVRLMGEHLSLSNITLSQEQIHKFESIGISSEWHSSAICKAFLKIQLESGVTSPTLDLKELYTLIEEQPLEIPAIERGIAAIQLLCKQYGIDPDDVVSTITDSENINRSLTMQWFQELVLGSETYQTFYKKPAILNVQSYLQMYDSPLLSSKNAERIVSWVDSNKGGVAIMTNRPSSGPSGLTGSPEAELGRDLVQLSGIPIIGYGDITWLAESIQADAGMLVKPHASHALAAILCSIGLDKQMSMKNSIKNPLQWPNEISKKLDGATITVLEDTTAGIISARNAVDLLRRNGIDVEFRVIGIAKDNIKRAALESQGAQLFQDINTALFSIENFGSLSRN